MCSALYSVQRNFVGIEVPSKLKVMTQAPILSIYVNLKYDVDVPFVYG